MSVWTHLLPRRAVAGKDVRLFGAHADADGVIWVWGAIGREVSASVPGQSRYNQLFIRHWDAVNGWLTLDKPNPQWPLDATIDETRYFATSMMSAYPIADGVLMDEPTAFASDDLDRSNTFLGGEPTHNFALWNGVDWWWQDDLFNIAYLVGRAWDDVYALMGFPTFGIDQQGINYMHWNGTVWSAFKAEHLTELDPTPTTGFWGGKVGGLNPLTGGQGHLADITPDGTVYYVGIYTGGGNPTVLTRFLEDTYAEVVLSGGTGSGALYFRDLWTPANDAHYAILEGSSARGLYFSVPGDEGSWDLLDAPGAMGYGICIHGMGEDDWWMGVGLQVAHWDGTDYTVYDLPDPHTGSSSNATIFGLWAHATDDVWGVGYERNTATHHYEGIVWHWDGADWSAHTVFTS